MTLTDIVPASRWEELEREIARRYRLNASVTDNEGARVTTYENYCNELCKRIKTDPKGASAICAVAGQYFASQIKASGEPLLEECDAGMGKIAVPIRVNGEVLGSVGCCGVLIEDGEVDDFMIARSLGVDESKLEPLMASVPHISREQAEQVRTWLSQRVDEIIETARP